MCDCHYEHCSVQILYHLQWQLVTLQMVAHMHIHQQNVYVPEDIPIR